MLSEETRINVIDHSVNCYILRTMWDACKFDDINLSVKYGGGKITCDVAGGNVYFTK